ncbi:uncharacterized protein BDZ99DRAFT_461585 [Mytilinidion resinicola]|uniref:F-box domain-containing protein n=1 Tax=Mytilinidion resinicola TaxID=574789 RepID=A0A6A6YRZ8_9PEZI|nr:uncharacterized protein BDZ99DRAFT_461585 [Mytilinidion resinicola]KAF2811551.1 hypothetical protein BDZ99DRAFT_461585 [Mytilinidion resinicola]
MTHPQSRKADTLSLFLSRKLSASSQYLLYRWSRNTKISSANPTNLSNHFTPTRIPRPMDRHSLTRSQTASSNMPLESTRDSSPLQTPELIERMASNLDVPDLIRFVKVCKQWKEVVDNSPTLRH